MFSAPCCTSSKAVRKDNSKNEDSLFSLISCGGRNYADNSSQMPKEFKGIKSFEGIDLRSEEYEDFRQYMKICCDGNIE